MRRCSGQWSTRSRGFRRNSWVRSNRRQRRRIGKKKLQKRESAPLKDSALEFSIEDPSPMKKDSEQVRERVDAVYRTESRKVLATLIRLLGDFDLAEEALHDAFTAALNQWPKEGMPNNPRAWLVSAGRFKAIDTMRRRARFDASLAELAAQIEITTAAAEIDDERIDDDQLR